MNTLLLLLSMMVLQESPGFPYPDFVLEYYPKTVMPGDTLYMKVVAKNPHDESIYIQDHFLLTTGSIRIWLRDTENQTQFLLFQGSPRQADPPPLRFVEIKPEASRIIHEMSINVPPLEDLNEPFWEKHLKNLSESQKEERLSLCISVIPHCVAYEREYERFHFQFTFETPLVLKLRPEKEMVLIRNWLENTPKELLPISSRGDNPIRKIPSGGRSTFPRIENILIKGEKARQDQFMRDDNRYPGHPNSPETWQSWQELEEGLTPSTMRDEIRLMRILMQYCDTDDVAVLNEFKDWFDGMNEVQRTVLVKSLRDQASATYVGAADYDKKFFPPLLEVYKTIREYDVVPVLESNIKSLQDRGIIE